MYQFSRNGNYFMMQSPSQVQIYRVKLNAIGKLSFYLKNNYPIALDELTFSKDNKTLIGLSSSNHHIHLLSLLKDDEKPIAKLDIPVYLNESGHEVKPEKSYYKLDAKESSLTYAYILKSLSSS